MPYIMIHSKWSIQFWVNCKNISSHRPCIIIPNTKWQTFQKRYRGKIHSIHILPLPHPCAVLIKHFDDDRTQDGILPFSNIWKGKWGYWHLFCRYYDYYFMFQVLRIFQHNLSKVVCLVHEKNYTETSF